MSIEQFEVEMAKAGYDEEQIANIKAKLEECTQALVLAFEEIIDRFMEIMASVWEGVKDTLAELAEKLNDWFEQEKKEHPNQKKYYVPYNPPNDNSWYNQYMRRTTFDKRANIEPFIIHRR